MLKTLKLQGHDSRFQCFLSDILGKINMNECHKEKKKVILFHAQLAKMWKKCLKSWIKKKICEIFFKTKIKMFFQTSSNLDLGTHEFLALFSIFKYIVSFHVIIFFLPFECSYTSLRLQLSISLFKILMDFFLLFHMSQNNYFRT